MIGQELEIRVQPRARTNEIAGERGGVVIARVTAPPADGRANQALRRLIAREADVGVRRVQILSGAAARQKSVRVEGLSAQQLRAALLRSR